MYEGADWLLQEENEGAGSLPEAIVRVSALSGEGVEDLHRVLQEMLQPFRTASDAGDDGGFEEFFDGRRRQEFGAKTDWSESW